MLLDKQQIRDTANKHDRLKKIQKYKTMHSAKKNDLFNKKAQKYKTIDAAKKQDLLDKQAENYKTMDTGKKQDLLNKQAEKYKTMGSFRKQELLERYKETYNCNSKNITLDSCIQQLKKKIREGPYYVCHVCNRALYKKSVLTIDYK